ncbi:uncharacterized protein LOC118477759 [Aplysia californica]|uniref:Uncharacterized protein LOC118477759 n=1 Tax=Aplysia californica TaxID=6500 RepID=A0ABM1VTZ7_APLCA|nr:uncharacterized protein LOC118477759 [Aplysia californica]
METSPAPKSLFVPSETYVSTETVNFVEIIIDFFINFAISCMGVVTNILVIVVFIKQGFRDSVSVSMTTIAAWDLLKCWSGALQRLVGPMELLYPREAHSWRNISHIVLSHTITFSTYVTSALAAYVAVERCLCVCFPLHVKWLLTRKISTFMCITISVVVFGSFCVMFGAYDLVWVWNARFNGTVAIYRYSSFALANEGHLFPYYKMIGIVWPFLSFGVITFCTCVISQRLYQASSFRNKQKHTDLKHCVRLNRHDGER